MFQFRAFPSYAYFIQRTIPEYCSGGFPHSEISGSTDICSSPKLIAACHVLRRLLMPRHSPCALISLTFVEETRSIPFPSLDENFISAPSFSSFGKNRFLPRLGRGLRFRGFSNISLEIFGSLELCRQSTGFSRNCNCTHIFSDVPQLKFKLFQLSLKDLSVALLFITFLHCSVFKVQSSGLF